VKIVFNPKIKTFYRQDQRGKFVTMEQILLIPSAVYVVPDFEDAVICNINFCVCNVCIWSFLNEISQEEATLISSGYLSV
jgi:hypothetical protein